jgi:small-conductance mechanosensitive channel
MNSIQEFLNTELLTLADSTITVGQLLLIPVVIIFGYLLLQWMIRLVSAAMIKRNVNPDIRQIISRAIAIIGLIILAATILDLLSVPLAAFAFVSGAIAIGVGFGAQNIINNFISGWILMWERPIRINDFIEIGSTSGTVEEINTRSTRIRRVDGVHLMIPNSKLLEETVVNWTLIDQLLRCIVRVGVAYGSDVLLVKELLLETAYGNQHVLREPEVQVIFEDFGDSALIFDLYFWVNSVGDKSARQIRSEIRFAIEEIFRKHDVVIAFPQRDLHLNGSISIDSLPRSNA